MKTIPQFRNQQEGTEFSKQLGRSVASVSSCSPLHHTGFAVRELKGRKAGKSGFCVLCALLWLNLLPTSNAATLYVWQESPSPAPPYTNWATAAHVIQDAVDAAAPGDTILVTNGVYATGGRAVDGTMTNRAAVDKPLNLLSVNGPRVTIIEGRKVPGGYEGTGDGAIRCVYLTNGASLSGFTLTNGATRSGFEAMDPERKGGGLFCESTNAAVSSCVLTGNSADFGGGAHSGALNNCLLARNSALVYGGGAVSSTLNNCIVTGNGAGGSPFSGSGGVYECTMNNCIVYYNLAPAGPNYDPFSTFNYSCTTPLPAGGIGNITNAPRFVDTNGWSNLRLQSNSPCINAGNNPFVSSSTDLDGRPRIVGGTVDMGAYEFQGPGLGEFIGWLQHHALPTDGSADTLDADLDGHNNWQEWKAWTDPTDALSVLKLLPPQPDTNGTVVLWQSVSGQSYFLQRATNASGPFSLLQGNIPGQTGTTSVTDTNPASSNPILYRVGVPE